MTLFRGLFLLHFGVHLLEIDSDNWKFQFYRLEEVTLEEQYNASYPCCSSYNSLAIHWNTKCCCWSTAQIKATGWNWNAFIRTGPKEPRGSSNFLFFSLFLISLLFFARKASFTRILSLLHFVQSLIVPFLPSGLKDLQSVTLGNSLQSFPHITRKLTIVRLLVSNRSFGYKYPQSLSLLRDYVSQSFTALVISLQSITH